MCLFKRTRPISKEFIARLEFYNINEERYNTLRNAGIDDYEMDAYIRVGLDLNRSTIYKVKQLVEMKKERDRGILRYCCFC